MNRTLRVGLSAACAALVCFLIGSPARADLLGLYTFDDGTGADSSHRNNDADVFSGPTPINAVPTGGAVDGLGYFSLDGNDFLHTPLNTNPDVLPQFTMGAWVRIPSGTTAAIRQVLAHDDGGWDRSLGTDVRGTGAGMGDVTYRYTGFTGNGPLGPTTAVAGTEGNWVFLAMTYDVPAGVQTLYVDGNAYSATPSHGPSVHNMFIGANGLGGEGMFEHWIGDIDNVFFFDTALDVGFIEAIRIGGPEVIQALADPQPARVETRVWDFETGDLDGFSVVSGTAFDNQPTFGDNPQARVAVFKAALLGSGVEGNWSLGTYESRPNEASPVGNQGDIVTGVIETEPWVLGDDGLLTFKIGGGQHPWSPNLDPDNFPTDGFGPTAVTLERLVGPGDWEVILSATGKNNEVMHNERWDLSTFAGDTVRLRVYDLHTGAWGHVNVDSFRYAQAVPEPTGAVMLLVGLGACCALGRRRWSRLRANS